MKKLLLFLAFLGSIQVSHACKCDSTIETPSFREFNYYTEIFQAQLIKKERNPNFPLINYSLCVEKAYKGVQKDEIIVIKTPNTSGACGQYIDYESSWLIYAIDGFIHRCSFNKKLDSTKHNPIIEKLNFLKETSSISETNLMGDIITTGKLNSIKQPIGNWTYIFEKNECTVTRNVCYDDYGCILENHSVKSCN